MRAIYAFSGDPITYGHIDIVRRASSTYDEVLVAIGENPQKTGKYLLPISERLALAKSCLEQFDNVSCATFSGFDVIIRGVRNNSDLEGELVQFAVNESLHPTVDTVFFPTRPHLSHISSGVVKALVAEGGDVSDYCPLCVKEKLESRILGKFTVGVAGGIAAGKTYVAKRLVAEIGKKMTVSYVSLDSIGHYILGHPDSMIFGKTRRQIANRFGNHILCSDGTVNRKALGRIVFADPTALADLNEIMHEPMLARLYEESRELPLGVVVIEGAILVEAKWTNLVNNNILLVDADEDLRVQRQMQRSGLDEKDARAKIQRQISAAERKSILEERINKHNWGRIWTISNNDGPIELDALVKEIVGLASTRI
jgi:pantetheine-phosphate adenylyltransferase/dephospho-CoA kinase